MDDKLKKNLLVVGVVILAIASFTYGALTAPQPDKPQPSTTITAQKSPAAKPTKQQLEQQLVTELPTITGALTAAYPRVATDYTVAKGQLFDEGQWYGTTLLYHGSDTLNRDTLRVLMQKKGSIWTLRTTPPQPLLSVQQFPDVPRDILKKINEPVSLP